MLRLRYTGRWKPFRDLQKIVFDSIMNMRYVIIEVLNGIHGKRSSLSLVFSVV